jgi:FtsZ-interacting cell division protein ZipA
MSTIWIIVIVAVAVIVLFLLLGWLGRRRQTGKKREEAAGLREEAQTKSRRAKQAELQAEEHAARARREREAAEHAARARKVDPDVDERDEEEAGNRT